METRPIEHPYTWLSILLSTSIHAKVEIEFVWAGNHKQHLVYTYWPTRYVQHWWCGRWIRGPTNKLKQRHTISNCDHRAQNTRKWSVWSVLFPETFQIYRWWCRDRLCIRFRNRTTDYNSTRPTGGNVQMVSRDRGLIRQLEIISSKFFQIFVTQQVWHSS